MDEQMELFKCMAECQYWVDNYGYCFNSNTHKIELMKCYDYQREALSNFEEFQNNIVLKSRQTGFSVITAAYIAWTVMFKSDQRVLILANDLNSALRLLKTVKEFINNTPEYLRPPGDYVKNNDKFIEFSNKSWAKAVACSPQAGRGESLTLLAIDETAFIENDDDIKAGALMAVSKTGGKTIMISTPKGTSNLYYDTWVKSIKGENNFKRLVAHWTQNPDCIDGLEERVDQETGNRYKWSNWYQKQCELMGWDRVKISQELDLSFESSKYLAVDSNIVSKYKLDVKDTKPVCYFDYQNHYIGQDPFIKDQTPFWIYEKPQKGKKYVLAADVAIGHGKDYSTIQILDAINMVQVAEFQSKITSDKFADVILPAAMAYNNAFVVIEANNMGLVTCYYLHKTLGYKNVYKQKAIENLMAGPRDARFRIEPGDEIPGFRTDSKTRPFLVSCLRKYMGERTVKINSPRLMAEFDTFIVKPDGRAEHEKNANDDLIIAFAISLFIRDTELEKVTKGKNMYNAMLMAITKSTSPYSGHVQKEPTIQPKDDTKSSPPIIVAGSDAYNVQKENENMDWLFD